MLLGLGLGCGCGLGLGLGCGLGLGLGCGGVCKGDYVCYFTVLLMLCNVMSRIRGQHKNIACSLYIKYEQQSQPRSSTLEVAVSLDCSMQ